MTMKDYSTYFEGKDWVHQLGFCAPDWHAFMTAHNRLFGSGPFFYTTNTFGKLLYHGEEVDCKGLEFHACYGAWGSHSIEVVTQNDWSIPTMFTELNKEEEPGLNHVHIFVDSLAEAQDACDFLGIDVITVGYGARLRGQALVHGGRHAQGSGLCRAVRRAACQEPPRCHHRRSREVGRFARDDVHSHGRKVIFLSLPGDVWDPPAGDMPISEACRGLIPQPQVHGTPLSSRRPKPVDFRSSRVWGGEHESSLPTC